MWLRKRQFPINGRKTELIERLENSIKSEHGIKKECRISLTSIQASKAVVSNKTTEDGDERMPSDYVKKVFEKKIVSRSKTKKRSNRTTKRLTRFHESEMKKKKL